MKALLIVDLQNDFLPGGALGVKEGDQIIPIINALQEKFSMIIATKDWHPPDHVSFAAEHGKPPFEVIEIEGARQELWPVHCVQETPGADFPPTFHSDKITKVFYKGVDREVDSYSAFFDNAHRRSTGLAEYLKEQGVDELFIVGLTTEYCVRFSVEDAYQLGIPVTVVIDACRGVELKSGDIANAIEEMRTLGASIITSEEVLQFQG